MTSPDKKLTVGEIEEFLRKTGFVFEMEVSKYLKGAGWNVDASSMYLDLEEEKKREIDIVATKTVNKIEVHLVIECKQSQRDDWIFIKTKEEAPRYFRAVKHSPRLEVPKKGEPWVFDNIHYFNQHHLICQNYIAVNRDVKKSDPSAIDDALQKLPKAIIDVVSQAPIDRRSLYFPVLCFSGQIFYAAYDKVLDIKCEDFVQFCSEYESETYEEIRSAPPIASVAPVMRDLGNPWRLLSPKETKVKRLKEAAHALDKYQTIDIVSFSGIESFLRKLEDGVMKTSWNE